MHGALFRNLRNTSAVQKITSTAVEKPKDPNKEYHANGTWSFKDDVCTLYDGNPYFKGVSEDAEQTVTLDKKVPEGRHMSDREDFERSHPEGIGHPDWYQKTQTLDDFYKGNPYYKPAKA